MDIRSISFTCGVCQTELVDDPAYKNALFCPNCCRMIHKETLKEMVEKSIKSESEDFSIGFREAIDDYFGKQREYVTQKEPQQFRLYEVIKE